MGPPAPPLNVLRFWERRLLTHRQVFLALGSDHPSSNGFSIFLGVHLRPQSPCQPTLGIVIVVEVHTVVTSAGFPRCTSRITEPNSVQMIVKLARVLAMCQEDDVLQFIESEPTGVIVKNVEDEHLTNKCSSVLRHFPFSFFLVYNYPFLD